MKLRLKSRLTLPNVIALVLIGLVAGLLIYKLGSLTPGLAAGEQPLPTVKASLEQAWNDPLLLPYTLSQLLVALVLPTGGYSASRLPAVVLGALLLVCMYWLLKQWYGQRLALFGTALLATAPWFLHVARFADASIVYPLSMALLLALASAWHKKERSKRILYASAIIGSLILYVPGMIWLVLCLVIFERRNIVSSLKAGKWQTALALALGLALLAPLAHRLYTNLHEYTAFLGWQGGWSQLTDYPVAFVKVWQYIFFGGYSDAQFNLGALPLISVLMTLAFAVGVYLYGQHLKATRTKLLAALWVVATALVSLPGAISNSLLLPVLIVLATGGIGYLLHLWLKVFPRNPFARSFGIGLLALLITFGVAYNLRSYYIAWPNSPTTEQTFSRQL